MDAKKRAKRKTLNTATIDMNTKKAVPGVLQKNKPPTSPGQVERRVMLFENEVGSLHDFESLGIDRYIEEWEFTLSMRYAQGEYTDKHDYVYHTSLLENIREA